MFDKNYAFNLISKKKNTFVFYNTYTITHILVVINKLKNLSTNNKYVTL